MSLFNQIVPSLARTLGRHEESEGGNSAEFTVKPVYEINETPEAWGLTVQLPGVARDGLDLTVEENVVTLRGRRTWKQPAGWTSLYRESVDAPYELVLEHGNVVDLDKIHAELKDGVLRVSLPKTEAVKPRKIAVN